MTDTNPVHLPQYLRTNVRNGHVVCKCFFWVNKPNMTDIDRSLQLYLLILFYWLTWTLALSTTGPCHPLHSMIQWQIIIMSISNPASTSNKIKSFVLVFTKLETFLSFMFRHFINLIKVTCTFKYRHGGILQSRLL